MIFVKRIWFWVAVFVVNLTWVTPGWKPVPVIAVIGTVVPRRPEMGVIEVTVTVLATVNVRVPDDRPSVFVTRIAQLFAAVTPARSKVQVICVGDTTTTLYALIGVEPLRVIFTVAPGWKLVPVRVTLTGQPRGAVVGLRVERVGAELATLT